MKELSALISMEESQLPVSHWHDSLGDSTIALDRLVHQAHHLNLAGESLRKLKPKLTEELNPE